MFYNPPLPLLIRRSGPVHCCWREMGLSDITASSQGTRKWAGGKKKKWGGWGGAGGRGRRNLVSEHRSHATHVHHWNSRPGLIFPSWLKLEKKLANYHNILYSDRTQLNYLGGKKVKQNRSESVFNCSWYAVRKQVALLNHLRASTAQGGASLKNNNTL